MISRLTGTITHIDPKYIIIDVGAEGQSVGYKVFTTADLSSKLPATASGLIGTPITLWTYLAVREDALNLYGFISHAELTFFELLITVSGIGPKTALGILNVASVHTLTNAIESGDTSLLTKVSGIGKKNAEKIVLELKDKIELISLTLGNRSPEHAAELAATARGDADVLEALKSLGYRESDAREALKKIDKSITNTGAKVKAALKLLS